MKWSIEKKNKIVGISLLITFIVYVAHATYNSIWLYNCQECSAPWHVELLFSSVVFSVPILILLGLKIYYFIRNSKAIGEGE